MASKPNFRNIGIGLLIASIIYFMFSGLFNIVFLFYMWIFDIGKSKEAVNFLFSSLFQEPIYTQLVSLLQPVVELIIFIWSLVLAVVLIRNKKCILQIRYFFYFVLIQYLVFFVLFLPLGNYESAIISLVAGLLVYITTIWKKGLLSKFIFNS